VRRTEGRAGLPLRRADTTSGRRGGRISVVGVVVALALGFAMGAVAEIFLMGGGWYSVLEDVVYPLAFVFALAGAFSGGFLLLAAEHQGDQRRAWRAVAVFVVSTVFAALLFWGAV
jgi:hypothetical protein